MFDNIIADLQGWRKQLDERAAELKKDQTAFNEQLVSLESTIKAHTAGVVVAAATSKKRSYKKSGLPSSAKIRGMVHRVLSSKKEVNRRELVDRIHKLAGLDIPKKVSDSRLTCRIYKVSRDLTELKYIKSVKGPKKGTSLTALGRSKSRDSFISDKPPLY